LFADNSNTDGRVTKRNIKNTVFKERVTRKEATQLFLQELLNKSRHSMICSKKSLLFLEIQAGGQSTLATLAGHFFRTLQSLETGKRQRAKFAEMLDNTKRLLIRHSLLRLGTPEVPSHMWCAVRSWKEDASLLGNRRLQRDLGLPQSLVGPQIACSAASSETGRGSLRAGDICTMGSFCRGARRAKKKLVPDLQRPAGQREPLLLSPSLRLLRQTQLPR